MHVLTRAGLSGVGHVSTDALSRVALASNIDSRALGAESGTR